MFTRRRALQTTSAGFGYLAFAALAQEAAARDAGASPLAPKKAHFTPRAKRVIFLCMDGGPSHVDTFDHKPKLRADDGKPFNKGRLLGAKLMASPFKFEKRGPAGLMISDQFPEVGKQSDKLCVLNGMATDIPNHPQAFLQMHCGLFQFPRPSLGSWVLYGLGTENANLPGFVTLNPPAGNGGPANYGSSFLPAVFQGTKVGNPSAGLPGLARGPGGSNKVANIENPRMTIAAQRAQLDFLQGLNQAALNGEPNPGVEGLIESYELAFRMQAELPKLMDTSKETAATKAMYGLDDDSTSAFGRQCLTARRMVEAGVRFVEVTKGGWDQHRNLTADLKTNCTAIDKPIAGLLQDLANRGLLKDTLVMWGGEFGRTPTAQAADGRDHNAKGYSLWMAGGGVKGGTTYGRTDEYGFEAVDGRVHLHDWHATILHLLGLDHEKLTYRHAGRDYRLTDVKGNVVKEIVA